MSENLSSPAIAMPSIQSLMFTKPLVSGFWPGCLAPDMKEVFFFYHHHLLIFLFSFSFFFSISSISSSFTFF